MSSGRRRRQSGVAESIARSAAQGLRSHRLSVGSHRLSDLNREVRLERYRDEVASIWTVRRRNRLNPARRLGCDVRILHFTGPTLKEGGEYIFAGCGGLDPGYIGSEWRNLPLDKGHLWAAVNANGVSQGYIIGHESKVSGEPAMIVDVLCSGSHAWNEDPERVCKNVAIHLMHRVEKDTKRLGRNIVFMEAVTSAVRFYARLGYKRTWFPCKFQEEQHKLYNDKVRAAFEYNYYLGKPLKRYLDGTENITNHHLRTIAAHKNRWAPGLLIPMSKCLRNV